MKRDSSSGSLAPARVRAHESAREDWLANRTGTLSGSPEFLLREGFDTGAEWAEGDCGAIHAREQEEWAVERATGQRQLDDAHALMAESVALFRGYADHHSRRAAEFGRAGDLQGQKASLQKARVNLLAALRLREWMAGLDRYTTAEELTPGEDSVVAHGEKVVSLDFPGLTGRETARRIADRMQDELRGNVRPVTDGPLAEPGVVEAIVDAAGGDAEAGLTLATDTAFRLTTADPRFDPQQPVRVNGYLYHRATEDPR